MPVQLDIDELVGRARDGVPRAIARLLSLVEDAHPQLPEVAAKLTPHTGHARVIGLTGPPGVGKSTSWATPQAVRVLDAAGFDVVLIETVGVGQSEVDVVKLADTTVVLLAPGMGDGIQAAKAGVLEIADVFVVNKADREGADATVHDLKQMISLVRREIRGPSRRQPIVRTVASRGEGVGDLVRARRSSTCAMAIGSPNWPSAWSRGNWIRSRRPRN